MFSGIGGLELGLERAGLGHVVWQVEQDAWCRGVLARHWPKVERFEDVRTVDFRVLRRARILCGGWPCQPASVAGKRLAQKDSRWLWPEVARAIEEQEPAVVVGENVPGMLSAGMRDVLADLARLGFDAEWATVSAVGLGAPHRRRRVFVVATHPDRVRLREQPGWLSRAIGAAQKAVPRGNPEEGTSSDTDCLRRLEQARRVANERGWSERCGWDFDPLAGVDDGLPRGLGRRARRALGNAVVVPVAEAVGRALAGAMA